MSKRNRQTTDLLLMITVAKAPQHRSLRSRKRKATEDNEQVTEQKDDLPVTETTKQDSDNINSTSQIASVSESTPQECSLDIIENTDSSAAEVNKLGDTITQFGGGVSSVVKPEETVTSEAPKPKPALSEGSDAHPPISTKDSQSVCSTSSAAHVSNQPKGSHRDQTSSPGPSDPSLHGEATAGEGPCPMEGGEELRESELESGSLRHHPQEGEDVPHLPREERPDLGSEASSQGADGGDPADAPARKRVRRRMGMGRLGGEREKRNLPEGGQTWGRGTGEKDGGEKEREASDGGEQDRVTDGENKRVTDGDRGLKVDDGPSLPERSETVQLGVTQLHSDTAVEHSSKETGQSHRNDSGPGWCDDRSVKEQGPVAIATTDGSRTALRSEKVIKEDDQNSAGPSKIASSEEQRDVTPAKETDEIKWGLLQKSMLEDDNREAKPSHGPSATRESASQSTAVGEVSPGNHIQNPAVTVATVAKHCIPGGLHKAEGAHHSSSDDVLKSTKGMGAPECDPVVSCSRSITFSEPAAPSNGEEDNIQTILEVKGHAPEKLTHITPDPCHDPDPFDPLSVNTVSDSQLNDITLNMEMEDQHVPESSRSHKDATELVCGLIRELSSLNRTIMAAHRELESFRRGNRTAWTPQRRPFTPRRPEIQPPSTSVPGQ
ncbi:cyclic nucleotide-gated cation channel beta-1 isoform X1 [Alosa alosa]|uniref:cyclic nucleotide-gated cation channel beta-1 isoform X1 n=1 Tax=Alosa alosa TaxID=278164 RepID=UPI0020153482|nr:cyclic nucleotide-gated cation channel beta-1 isoform X1 [Alosa alosa]XP_048103923.1 cyclic nucleotide-gated cation channel beta-1 isoform X1 [Alosa alosa]